MNHTHTQTTRGLFPNGATVCTQTHARQIDCFLLVAAVDGLEKRIFLSTLQFTFEKVESNEFFRLTISLKLENCLIIFHPEV